MNVAIIGVGNILMKDEGVGVRVIEELKKRDLPGGVDLYDAGTSIMDLMPGFGGYGRLIIVDAVRGGNEAGTVYKFRPEELEKNVSGPGAMSLHQLSLLDALAMDRLATGKEYDITIIGVEPDVIEMGLELSPALQEKVAGIADLVLEEALKGS